MGKTRKIAMLVTTSLAVFILVYSYLCFVFIPKDISDQGGDLYYRGKGFLGEPLKNSLDIIAFGHSGVYSGFSPATMYAQYGYTSDSSAAAKLTCDKANDLLQQALKTQKPKIILLDVDCLYLSPKYLNTWNVLGAPFIFHSRWKTLKAKDFYCLPGKIRQPDLSKGYMFSQKAYKVAYRDYMGDPAAPPLKLPKRNLKQLNKFVQKCKNNDIALIFIDFANMTSWNYAKHNYIRQYADKHGIDFLDMNVAQETYAVDFEKDFRDNGNHYNVYGAEKATKFLGAFLNEHYGDILDDRRQDARFAYWQDALNYYRQQFKNE